jgi:hypothetical protein
MNSWTAWGIAKQRAVELRQSEAGRHGRGTGHALRAGRDTTKAKVRPWQAISAWLGYRMINVGCRLARPAVLASARSGI